MFTTGEVYVCSQTGLEEVANIRWNNLFDIMEISKRAQALSEINNLEPVVTAILYMWRRL